MASVTWTCNKDSRVANNGSNLGAGASSFNPVGVYSGYTYFTLMDFPENFAGMVSITQAVLHLRTSTQSFVAFGSDPDIYVYRLTSSFSEGSSSGLSASNAVVYPGPGVANQSGPYDISTAESTWVTCDITAILQAAMAAGVFYGIRIAAATSAASDVTEFYSREGGSAAYIVVTYTTNVAPNVPTQAAPANGATGLTGTTPTLSFSHSDNDGDALLNYDIQVSTDPSFASVTHWNGSALTAGISGNSVNAPYVGAALTRGATYYWRVATRSATGVLTVSGWSGAWSFKLNQLPTLALVSPAAGYNACEMSYVAGAGGVPHAVIRWSFYDPDGSAQAFYQVIVQTESAVTVRDTGQQAGAASSYVVPDNLTRDTNYRVTVYVWDAAGENVGVNYIQFRPQWAVAEYRSNDLGVVTSWSATAASSGGTNKAVVTEYASSAAGGAVGTWYSSLAQAGVNHYFHWRVWLFAWAGATSPSFDRMSLTFSSSTGVPPDGWAFNTSQWSIDTGTHVYGTQSLTCIANGVGNVAYQTVPVLKNTDYILSGRIRATSAAALARLDAFTPSYSAFFGNTGNGAPATEWQRFQTPVFNSGDNEQILIRCVVDGASGQAWFDALKLEASRVVTAWTPGFVGAGVSVDAGGIKVDASPLGGGTFRLKGSAAGARDIVELGANGLNFGGDASLSSDLAGVLTVPPLDGFGMYGVRAGGWVSGGGTCVFDASANFKWTTRFIVIAQGNGTDSAATGYYDINCPLSGTVQGVGGHANVTATANGIPMDIWSALYVVLPKGGVNTAIDVTSFRIVNYAGAMAPPPSNWVLLALYNGDAPATLYVANGLRMQANQTLSAGGGLDVRGNVVVNGSVGIGMAAPGGNNLGSLGYGNFSALYEQGVRLFQPAGLRFQTGAVTRNVAASNGTVQGILTFPIAFSATPFVWAFANASAGNAAYTSIQSVTASQVDIGLKAATAFNYTVYWMAIGPA